MPAVIRIDAMALPAGECPDCGFDSLVQYIGCHLTSHGVTVLFRNTWCPGCADITREQGAR